MTLPDPAVFARIREAYAKDDEKREHTIKRSRDILKASKRAIYLVHEEKYSEARNELAQIDEIREDIREHGDTSQGSLRNALEEYVEAATLLAFMQQEELPSDQDLDVSAEAYLAGLSDTAGELVRVATRAATRRDYREIADVRDFIDALHGEILQLHLRNSHLRKKADSIKHHLQRVEHLQYETELRRAEED